jgi:hypothetical protein
MAVKRKRKMTAEQKAAAAERLAKARAVRAKRNPPEYKNIHPKVLARKDSDPLCLSNVKEWIKEQKNIISAEKQNLRRNVKGSEAKIASAEGYIRHMQAYLQHGDWIDDFWGDRSQNPTSKVCLAMAYDDKGFAKRSVGVWYPDIADVWTDEMDKAERASRGRNT